MEKSNMEMYKLKTEKLFFLQQMLREKVYLTYLSMYRQQLDRFLYR